MEEALTIKNAIRKMTLGEKLDEDDLNVVFESIMTGKATAAQSAALLVLIKMKGETAEDLAILSRVAHRHAKPCFRRDCIVDIVGTGGDGIGTFNISTAAAFIAAGAGANVAKHGNRASSSMCGSADLLEQAGAHFHSDPEQLDRVLEESGFCFLFAQSFHPGLKQVATLRKELGVRTIFNALGPLINPARPSGIVVGVYERRLGPIMIEALRLTGVKKALVVHGANGLDEISPEGETYSWILADNSVEEKTLTPYDFDLESHPVSNIRGGHPSENLQTLHDLLMGKASKSVEDCVIMNASALLFVANKAVDFRQGTLLARDSLRLGHAKHVFTRYIQASQSS